MSSMMSPVSGVAIDDATEKGTDDGDDVISDESISTGAVMLLNSSSRRWSSSFRNSDLSANVLSRFFFSLKKGPMRDSSTHFFFPLTCPDYWSWAAFLPRASSPGHSAPPLVSSSASWVPQPWPRCRPSPASPPWWWAPAASSGETPSHWNSTWMIPGQRYWNSSVSILGKYCWRTDSEAGMSAVSGDCYS